MFFKKAFEALVDGSGIESFFRLVAGVRIKVRSVSPNNNIRLNRNDGLDKGRSTGSKLIKSLKFSNKRFDRFILSFGQLLIIKLLTIIKNLFI